VGHEIEQLAHEDNPMEVLKALEKEGWLKVLVPHFSVAKVDTAGLNQVFKVKQQLQEVGVNPDASPIVMHFLTRKLPDKDIAAMQKQIVNKGFVERWKHLEDDAKDFAKKLMAKDLALPSQTWQFLMTTRPDALLFNAITPRASAVEQKIKNFLTKWPPVRQKLPFPEMAEMRITLEHPEYKKILDEAFLMLLDGKLRSHTEIVKFLEPYSPPEPPPPPPPPRRGRAKKEATPGTPGDQAPKKRGRKPKNAVAGEAVPSPAAPVAEAAPVQPAAAPAKHAATSAKQKAAPAAPVAAAKKAAPAKAAPTKAAAKPATKKPAVKKAAPKKAAPAKKKGKKK
jgi:tRNA nucleotidyltransferase (CCA-adding enzyme)